jgi:hypothetical protein
MKNFFQLCGFLTLTTLCLAAEPEKKADAPMEKAPAKPVLKITPGQVIVPTDTMRRPWGEVISIDLATRTGKFRNESNDEVMTFTAMPYAEMLHHAAFGDLSDFKVGERVIFRLHPNDAGEWVWLTYIQDEMNMLHGHKEYYHVDAIDADKATITFTQANADQSYVREKGLKLETDAATKFWKDGAPAKFSDIKLGDKLRAKTHGRGKGKVRIAWDVFLDDASLLKFQTEQKAVHLAKLKADGCPGYVDSYQNKEVQLTMFQEGTDITTKLKPKQEIKIAACGIDRKPIQKPIGVTIVTAKAQGKLVKITAKIDAPAGSCKSGDLVRLWTE